VASKNDTTRKRGPSKRTNPPTTAPSRAGATAGENDGDDPENGARSTQPPPSPEQPYPRPATDADFQRVEKALRDRLFMTAHDWRDHAYQTASVEHLEIASVLMALLTSSGLGLRAYAQNKATGKLTERPNPTARKWRRDASNAAWDVVRDPVLADNLEAQVWQIEMSIKDGTEHEATDVLRQIAWSPSGSAIRAHAPRLQSEVLYTPAGLRQRLKITPAEVDVLLQDVLAAWEATKESRKWDGMSSKEQRRALVLDLFRTLGSPRPTNVYAAQNSKAARARAKAKADRLAKRKR
jgi:hypothetical protein